MLMFKTTFAKFELNKNVAVVRTATGVIQFLRAAVYSAGITKEESTADDGTKLYTLSMTLNISGVTYNLFDTSERGYNPTLENQFKEILNKVFGQS